MSVASKVLVDEGGRSKPWLEGVDKRKKGGGWRPHVACILTASHHALGTFVIVVGVGFSFSYFTVVVVFGFSVSHYAVSLRNFHRGVTCSSPFAIFITCVNSPYFSDPPPELFAVLTVALQLAVRTLIMNHSFQWMHFFGLPKVRLS